MIDYNPEMFFPHEKYRDQQKETIQKIYQGMFNGKPYVLKAPNGTGKSSIGLSSTLPIIYEKGKKLVYLCRTIQQNDRVIRELKKIKKKQSFVSGIAIRGRNNMCINELFLKDNPSMKELMQLCQRARKTETGCKYYKSFFNKDSEVENDYSFSYNDKLSSIIEEFSSKIIDTDELMRVCKERKICPYYMIKIFLSQVDIVVCNYLWMFHQQIRKYVFLEDLNTTLDDIILIIDECHNLPETVLDINEEQISLNIVQNCSRLLEKYSKSLAKSIHYKDFQQFGKVVQDYLENVEKSIFLQLEEKKKYITTEGSIDITGGLKTFLDLLNIKTFEKFGEILESAKAYAISIHLNEEIETSRKLRNWLLLFINFWSHWLKILSNKDLKKIHYTGYFAKLKTEKMQLYLHIKPFSPMRYILPVLKNNFSSLHMSGTIDTEIYANLTGLNNFKNGYGSVDLELPFSQENRLVIIDLDVTSRSGERNLEMYGKYNQKIKEILEIRSGNTGIFAVSYDFIKNLNLIKLGKNRLEYIIKNDCKRTLFIEKRDYDSFQNAEMIKKFKRTPKAVLLGVFGGRNSEGEDFPGKEMETVICVGFPFAPPSPYLDKKEEFFDSKFNNNGWKYAKLEPAIRKANQAAGRSIRTEKDIGVIVLLGRRYRDYRHHLSNWLTDKGVLKYSGENYGKLRNLIMNFMN
ncbi:hypothetical protein LCGC14_0638410 [marine sediment metagenome]|uniref:Helicase ATP-binding domain-containing protein n=1 Tax=marine sediment metagenome TaxID=412755 RepID=A0A0F9TLF1_9ZZZZ